jgi:hypothetical protein
MSAQKEAFDRFVQTISAVVKRPAMYGVSNVEGINLFILGFQFGCSGAENRIVLEFCSGFREFINQEHAEEFSNKRDYDWPRLIRFYSAGDMGSIELFGRWFDAFVVLFKTKHELS